MTLLIILAVAYFFLMTSIGIEILSIIMRLTTYMVLASPVLAVIGGLVYLLAKAVMYG